MALPTTGPISLQDIRDEFGGTGDIRLFDYYRGGSLVPNHLDTQDIPTSGQISLFDFRGSRALQSPLFDPASIGPGDFDTISSRVFSQPTVVAFSFFGNSAPEITLRLKTNQSSFITVSGTPQNISIGAGQFLVLEMTYTGMQGQTLQIGPSVQFLLDGSLIGEVTVTYFGGAGFGGL
jgi:hypothetical protein